MSYDNAFEEIEDFFNFILAFAKVYKNNSELTVNKLQDFKGLLRQDETNFIDDFDWLVNNVTAIAKEEFEKNFKLLNNKFGQSNESNEYFEKLSGQINATLDKTKQLQELSVARSSKCKINLNLIRLQL